MTKEPTLLWALWVSLGAMASLVGLGIRAILKGDLVAKAVLDRAHAEGDKWENAWMLSQQTMGEFGGRLDANTEALRLHEQLLTALATRGPTR